MKNIKNIILSLTFILISSGLASTPGLNVITINTDDAQRYASWLQKAIPIFEEVWGDNVVAFGICSPISGAEKLGNNFVWSVAPSLAIGFASANDVYEDPKAAREIQKIIRSRTVERRDSWGIIKNTERVYGAGETTAQYNFMSTPESVLGYVSAIEAMEAAAAENGFGDIQVAVFEAAGAGDRAGMVIASVQAPNLQRLGAFLDERWSSWMAESMSTFPTLRTPEHEWVNVCTTLYSNSS